MTTSGECWARLDFSASPDPQVGRLLLPTAGIVTTNDVAAVPACLDQVQQAVAAGAWAVGFVAYEAAPSLDSALQTRPARRDLPLLWFVLCRQPTAAPPTPDAPYAFTDWRPRWREESFLPRFGQVMQHLRDGDCYQLNLTFPLTARVTGDLATLYADLCRAQAPAYCAWLHGPGWDVLSASPELFFAVADGMIQTRPMKGTRTRGRYLAEDQALAAELPEDPKERAENVMIVDLLRNDLGRVAVTGTVTVPALFQVEKYPTVWQMTSTVQARLRPDTGLRDWFTALFPCGSVTGAPKVKSMELISRLETTPRGVYCGAIGYLAPGGRAVFNVGIRTLTVARGGRGTYHVGSGLVADSGGPSEYRECLAKARVLQRARTPSPTLVETLLWTPDRGFFLEAEHLQRLAASAEYFSYACEVGLLEATLEAAAGAWSQPMRVRLLLHPEGESEVQAQPLTDNPLRRLVLSTAPVDSQNVFLFHKTTARTVYDTTRAAHPDADDVILYNERDELTETCVANLALWREGRWVTPPVTAGLLAGVMRGALLAAGLVVEGTVRRDELAQPQRLWVFNSVRGVMEFAWDGQSGTRRRLLGVPSTPDPAGETGETPPPQDGG